MTDFLLELRSEEIPARMQDKARDDLARLFVAELGKAGIQTAGIVTFATPRRLALIARDLPTETAAVSEEVKGPKTSAPPQALEGFLRKTGLTREQLVERDGVLFAVTDKPGRATTQVLAVAIPAIVRAFPWPKSMRWGASSLSTESLRWVRPLHGIVALFGDAVVPVEIAGVTSGAATLGHRFHHAGEITIGSAADYEEKLRACHVIVDQDQRRAIIRDRAAALAAEAGLALIEDEGLVAENAGLTEWPVPLLGRFDAAFLDVPPEVIQLTARVNQKYFVCRDADGKLANAFVCTANIEASDGGAKIVEGNRKVLAARLADAKFFYDTDLKMPLDDQAAKLGQIVFHEKLGTVADKVDRVAKLARWLVEEGIVGNSSPAVAGEGDRASQMRGGGAADAVGGLRPPPLRHQPAAGGPPPRAGEELASLAERAARLAKADLVTGMVGEFPELQGLMGGYYAAAQGEDPRVAAAIRDHYKPVGQGDDVPTDPVTVAMSLADKLDTIYAFFVIGEPPSGSRDPFALRRQILALISLCVANNLRLPLSEAMQKIGLVYQESYTSWMAEWVPGLDEKYSDWKTDRKCSFGEDFSWLWRIIDEARDAFLATVPEIPEDPEDAFNLREQERRLGAMHRAYAGTKLVFYNWNEITAPISGVIGFAADRLKVQQREAGVRHDLIDAVFALGGEDDLVRLLARVHALQAFVGTDDGANLLAGYKRAANILKKEGYAPLPGREGLGVGADAPASAALLADDAELAALAPTPGPSLEGRGEKGLSYTPEKDEAALIAALDAAEPAAAEAVAREDFEGAMAALATLRAPIDAFFDSVTVNDPDAAKRAARLALLARVRAAVHNVADFSRIEG